MITSVTQDNIPIFSSPKEIVSKTVHALTHKIYTLCTTLFSSFYHLFSKKLTPSLEEKIFFPFNEEELPSYVQQITTASQPLLTPDLKELPLTPYLLGFDLNASLKFEKTEASYTAHFYYRSSIQLTFKLTSEENKKLFAIENISLRKKEIDILFLEKVREAFNGRKIALEGHEDRNASIQIRRDSTTKPYAVLSYQPLKGDFEEIEFSELDSSLDNLPQKTSFHELDIPLEQNELTKLSSLPLGEKVSYLEALFQKKAHLLMKKIKENNLELANLPKTLWDAEYKLELAPPVKPLSKEDLNTFYQSIFLLCLSNKEALEKNASFSYEKGMLKENSSYDKNKNTATIQTIQSYLLRSLGHHLGFRLLQRLGLDRPARDCPPFTLLNAIHLSLALFVRFDRIAFENYKQMSLKEEFLLLQGTPSLTACFTSLASTLFSFSSENKAAMSTFIQTLKTVEEIAKKAHKKAAKDDPNTLFKKLFLRDLSLFKISFTQTFLQDPDFSADHITPIFAEWFAKYASYGDYMKGNFIKYKDNIFEVEEDILFAIPNNLIQGLRMCISSLIEKENTAKNDLKVISFRGTSPSGIEFGSTGTIGRDFDVTGTGRETFQKAQEDLFVHFRDNFEIWVKENEDPTKKLNLLLTGHSLGACDSQRFLNLLVSKIAAGELPNSERIGKIQVDLQNSPHPEKETSDQFFDNLSRLPDLEITLNYHYFEQDVIQQFGHPLILNEKVNTLLNNLHPLSINVFSYKQAKHTGITSVQERLDNHSGTYYTAEKNGSGIPSTLGKPHSMDVQENTLPAHYAQEEAVQFIQTTLGFVDSLSTIGRQAINTAVTLAVHSDTECANENYLRTLAKQASNYLLFV